MTCHLFLDNFFEISWPLGDFQRLRVLKQIFVSRELKYLNFDIMRCLSFLNLVFRKRRFYAENWLCFRACNSRIVTYEQEFCLVVWFCILITITESFSWKVFFWEVMVLSKTCVRFRNRIFKRFEWVYDQIIFFPVTFWVKDFSSPLWKKFFENFSVLGVDFRFVLESWTSEFGRVTFESGPSKGVNVPAIFRYVVEIEVF